MATVAGAGVLFLEESFLRLWVPQVDPPSALPTFLIVLMVVQLTFIRVDSNIIDLTLNIRRKVLLGLLSGGLCPSAWRGCWWSATTSASWVVAIGFIAGRAVQSISYPLMIGRILTIPTSAQVAAMLRAGTRDGRGSSVLPPP